MTRLLPTVTVLVVLLVGCAGADGDTADAGSTRDGASPACASEVDEALAAWEEAGFSGSIATSTGGEADCLAAYGLADRANGTPNTVDIRADTQVAPRSGLYRPDRRRLIQMRLRRGRPAAARGELRGNQVHDAHRLSFTRVGSG